MFTVRALDCINRNSIPKENETIDEIEIKQSDIKFIDIYYRSPEACPFARGNWIGDITFKDGSLLCVKLPKEMKEIDVNKYFKITQKE